MDIKIESIKWLRLFNKTVCRFFEIENIKEILFYVPFINYLFLDDNKNVVLKSKIFTAFDDFIYVTFYNLMYVFGYLIINN